MLLKWLFTILAIIWLYQALGPYFGIGQGPKIRHNTPPPSNGQKKDDDGDSEYIDYEEIK